MKDDRRPWGFWFPIKDAEDALYAAKLTGLPVFLAGLWSAAASFASLTLRPGWTSATILVVGCVFIIAGLQIRKGRLQLVPVLVPLYILLVGLNVILVFKAFAAINVTLAPTFNMLIPVLTGILSLNGLRGWWWLRQNGA